MPINIPDKLPAHKILNAENIFVMKKTYAAQQDIRAQKVAIVNLMPVKITTETHILRLLSNTPLQVEIDLVHMKSHKSKNTPSKHLKAFYKTFDDIKKYRYDGLIITGAPVELIAFEKVDYWDEIKKIIEWSSTNVTSTLFICWAAQAALYYLYGIPKYNLKEKMFGVFEHRVLNKKFPLVRGFDDVFLAPQSRHTEIRRRDIEKIHALDIISESDESGIYIVAERSGKQIFITGHSEYDSLTLKEEYLRDKKKGMKIAPPKNYFKDDNPKNPPVVKWRSHANLLFSNWLNYFVYQITPFVLNK